MASRSSPVVSSIMRQLRNHPRRASAFLRAPITHPVASFQPLIASRAAHAIPRPPAQKYAPPKEEQSRMGEEAPQSEGERPEIKPSYYQLSFTCVPCGHRSHHNVSKQGYHYGSTLITCPSCRNRHVISDHLNIFGDRKITVEDLMREKGQLVKRGSLGEDGDIEFWPETTLAEGGDGTGKSKSS